MSEEQQPAAEPLSAKQRKAILRARLTKVVKILVPLAVATVFMLVGFFLLWQASLVYGEGDSAQATEASRTQAVTDIAAKIGELTNKVAEVAATEPVQTALASADAAGLEGASAAFRQAWPEVTEASFYAADLNAVRKQDLKAFGYARAQMLLQAQIDAKPAPAQVISEPKVGKVLALAMPVQVEDATAAFVYVSVPAATVTDILGKLQRGNGRLDLRQGDGRGDAVLASAGPAAGSSMSDRGVPIEGTRLRLAIAQPIDKIVVTRNLWVLVPLTLICLLAGFVALWLRQVGMQGAIDTLRRGGRSAGDEITFAEALRQQAEAQSTTAAKPASTPSTAAASPPQAPVKPAARSTAALSRSIFRAYDIRGVLGQTLNNDIARQIGQAIGSEAKDRGLNEIVVGRDGRASGPELSAALIEGLRAAGCDVIDIGLAATPLTYFAAYHLQTGSCVSVTGSHNPPEYNGFKVVLGGETLSEGAIQDLYARIAEDRMHTGSGGLQVMGVDDDYVNRIADDVQVETKLKVVIDCGNGVAGAIAPAVLNAIGCEVHELYCEVDGSFPNHHPDPSDPHNLQDLILSVKQTGADIGLAFDGDGDRLGVVTRSGEIIYPDRLLMLFAIDVLSRNPGATIIYDVKCTGHLQPVILQNGGSPIMWRTGHSLIKAKMRETGAQLAGEMSGHFFFAERWYGFDDGIYSAARLLEILAADPDGRSPEQIFAALPKGVSTPELKIELREGEHYRFIEAFKAKASFEDARLTTIDGVRADWPDGWGLVRASNTTPVLVLRFDADNDIALKRIQQAFRTQLAAIDPALPLPF